MNELHERYCRMLIGGPHDGEPVSIATIKHGWCEFVSFREAAISPKFSVPFTPPVPLESERYTVRNFGFADGEGGGEIIKFLAWEGLNDRNASHMLWWRMLKEIEL